MWSSNASILRLVLPDEQFALLIIIANAMFLPDFDFT